MKVLISTVPSDSHTWNLVYIQMLLEELQHNVVNLGHCVPVCELVRQAYQYQPDVIVISTVNGHGHIEGIEIVEEIKRHDALRDIKVVIGGKLGTKGIENDQYIAKLESAGYDAAFSGDESIAHFQFMLKNLTNSMLRRTG